jgi:hypothetical protein
LAVEFRTRTPELIADPASGWLAACQPRIP